MLAVIGVAGHPGRAAVDVEAGVGRLGAEQPPGDQVAAAGTDADRAAVEVLDLLGAGLRGRVGRRRRGGRRSGRRRCARFCVAPVQAVPLRVNTAGAGLLPLHAPLKPNAAAAVGRQRRVVAGVARGDRRPGLGHRRVPGLGDGLAGGVAPGQRPAVDRVAEVGHGHVRAEAALPLVADGVVDPAPRRRGGCAHRDGEARAEKGGRRHDRGPPHDEHRLPLTVTRPGAGLA